MYHILILKGKTSVLNIYVYILAHVNKWGYEQLMSIQEGFHLIQLATVPAAPPYTADWTAAAILPPATPKK